MVLEIDAIRKTVQYNCHISDARYAAEYPLCIYLLKMREYFRWEHNIALGETLDQKALGAWLSSREAYWDEIAEQGLDTIVISDQAFDAFDNEAINQRLIPESLIYSAGMGIRAKPHFFFGRLREVRSFDDLNVYIADDEYARELTAPPAMSLGSTIYIRFQSLRRMIWEKMEEWMWHKNDSPMGRLLATLPGDWVSHLNEIAEHQLEMLVQHEVGESQLSRHLGEQWPSMILNLPPKLELASRAVRDNLADCLTTLPYLLKSASPQGMHFYMANISALRKSRFSALNTAYERWNKHGDWRVFLPVIERGKEYWMETVKDLLSIYHGQEENWQHQLEARLDLAVCDVSV